jgi:hypothetical protein
LVDVSDVCGGYSGNGGGGSSGGGGGGAMVEVLVAVIVVVVEGPKRFKIGQWWWWWWWWWWWKIFSIARFKVGATRNTALHLSQRARCTGSNCGTKYNRL